MKLSKFIIYGKYTFLLKTYKEDYIYITLKLDSIYFSDFSFHETVNF